MQFSEIKLSSKSRSDTTKCRFIKLTFNSLNNEPWSLQRNLVWDLQLSRRGVCRCYRCKKLFWWLTRCTSKNPANTSRFSFKEKWRCCLIEGCCRFYAGRPEKNQSRSFFIQFQRCLLLVSRYHIFKCNFCWYLIMNERLHDMLHDIVHKLIVQR